MRPFEYNLPVSKLLVKLVNVNGRFLLSSLRYSKKVLESRGIGCCFTRMEGSVMLPSTFLCYTLWMADDSQYKKYVDVDITIKVDYQEVDVKGHGPHFAVTVGDKIIAYIPIEGADTEEKKMWAVDQLNCFYSNAYHAGMTMVYGQIAKSNGIPLADWLEQAGEADGMELKVTDLIPKKLN